MVTRKTFAVTTTAVNEDFNADSGSVLVELTGTGGWDGTVDFQSTLDGSTYFNIPYANRNQLLPSISVAQITSPSTATAYVLPGALTQVRIAVGAGSVGSLAVVYRVVPTRDTSHVSTNITNEAIKQADINATASGDTTVVSLVSGVKIRVLSIAFTSSTAVAVAWKSGAGTTKIEAMSFATNGGMCEDFKPGYFVETDAGEALVVNLSLNANVRGIVNYIEVT